MFFKRLFEKWIAYSNLGFVNQEERRPLVDLRGLFKSDFRGGAYSAQVIYHFPWATFFFFNIVVVASFNKVVVSIVFLNHRVEMLYWLVSEVLVNNH